MTRSIIFLVVLGCIQHSFAAKIDARALKVVISGVGAVASMAEGTERWLKWRSATRQIEKMSELEGYDSSAAIYSIDFRLDPAKNAIYWADLIGKPDVYVVIEAEGYGSILVPALQSGYGGGEILKTVAGGNVKPGSKIRLCFFDDDSFSDSIWNSILQTKVEWGIGAAAGAAGQTDDKITLGLRAGAGVGGKIALLDRDVVIDQPDLLAIAELEAPASKTWRLDGVIYDSNGTQVGTMAFSKVDEIKISKGGIFGSIFFYGLALVLGLMFLKYYRAWSPQGSAAN